MAEVGELDPAGVVGNLATGGRSSSEPAVHLELGDVADRDLLDG
ncbi:MAG TPA: hypothetical protein VF230_15630 [Acidimicrobiales bacterium]